MARASRFNKKQPAFDPSELADLIFTPAVGTGVGSHLMEAVERFPAPPDNPLKANADLPTVDILDMTTVATVGGMNQSTADMSLMTTVGASHGTEAASDLSTVGESPVERHVTLWVTEHGTLVPEGRVKRIRLAQDAINSTEKSVYDTLWTAKSVQLDDPDSSRFVQAGYDYLVKRTGLAKRTIQRIVEKLIEKNFIAIERQADIYQRSSTVYRVFSYQTVLDHHIRKGRRHVAKIGPGFSYVRPLTDPRLGAFSYTPTVVR